MASWNLTGQAVVTSTYTVSATLDATDSGSSQVAVAMTTPAWVQILPATLVPPLLRFLIPVSQHV